MRRCCRLGIRGKTWRQRALNHKALNHKALSHKTRNSMRAIDRAINLKKFQTFLHPLFASSRFSSGLAWLQRRRRTARLPHQRRGENLCFLLCGAFALRTQPSCLSRPANLAPHARRCYKSTTICRRGVLLSRDPKIMFLSSSMAEHSAVNRRVVGSSPT